MKGRGKDMDGKTPVISPIAIGEAGRAARAVVAVSDGRFPERCDIAVSASRIGGVEVRAASVRGLSHRHYGTVRQDEYTVVATPDDRWVVAALADGVSSGAYSHLAAEIVTRTACAVLTEELARNHPADIEWGPVLRTLADEVRGCAAERFGARDDREASVLMATTGLFAVVAAEPDARGHRVAFVVSVGDTSAWVLRPSAEPAWLPLQAVKNHDAAVASSATDAIPLVPDGPVPVITAELTGDEVLVLMTDGVGDPLGAGAGEVGESLATAWRTPPYAMAFAAEVDFARKSFDDDRTVVGIWPVPDSAER
ncbi:protein phosphatase 2C domain-containing protein [Actinokineospora soli]|uniref:Protein phosphatase 2C domain-containing protein n=1 Tax=Actinokineospora soli TaxID=1048753 RepID=A0ABW2THD6_9PSEU